MVNQFVPLADDHLQVAGGVGQGAPGGDVGPPGSRKAEALRLVGRDAEDERAPRPERRLQLEVLVGDAAGDEVLRGRPFRPVLSSQ